MANQNDLKNLTKYPEFYALKQELLKFCESLDDISDIDLSKENRVTLNEEIFGRRWASDKVKAFLLKLGMVDQAGITKKDKTYE